MHIKKMNSHLSAIATILHDGHYHDGVTLGKKLGITRAAVCKFIKKLKDYGINIHSVKQKGYALLEPFVLLDRMAIQQQLKNNDLDIDIFESLPSTNDYLKSLHGLVRPRICLAEQQTQGKGRLNRYWHSPFGQNIYFSYSYFLEKDIGELAGLSLVVGLAIIHLLKQYQLPACIKWPNDVLYHGQKLSGNLIEVEAKTHDSCRIIIGIGINVNMLEARMDEMLEWASLRAITKQYVDRNKMCALLIKILLDYLKKFAAHGWSVFMNEWQSVDFLINKIITLQCGQQMFTGRMKGINRLGNLLLEVDHGIIKGFSSGDTSIVKQTRSHPIDQQITLQ